MSSGTDAKGIAIIAITFFVWGLFPLYWKALEVVPALQIMAHRVVWSTLLVLLWVCIRQRRKWWDEIRKVPRALPALALTSLLITFNWALNIWAINAGYVVASSLAYFINPLLNVLLGVLVLRERLQVVQWSALAIAGLGVAWLSWQGGAQLWIALALALSFALYGLVRKLLAVEAAPGLAVEGAYVLLPALGYLAWTASGDGNGFLGSWGWHIDALLVAGGALTAIPLIAFANGVKRIPLSLVGLLQYITPTLQLLIGVLIFKESFGVSNLIGFSLIWIGLAWYAGYGLWQMRRRAKHSIKCA